MTDINTVMFKLFFIICCKRLILKKKEEDAYSFCCVVAIPSYRSHIFFVSLSYVELYRTHLGF